jgi:hypothetical protein
LHRTAQEQHCEPWIGEISEIMDYRCMISEGLTLQETQNW